MTSKDFIKVHLKYVLCYKNTTLGLSLETTKENNLTKDSGLDVCQYKKNYYN